jgi:hypothetical protein
LKKKYGLTPERLADELKKRDGQCDACGRRSRRTLCIDHCHNTNVVRGFLCDECNTTLGQFNDDGDLLRKLANYADKFTLFSKINRVV